MILRIAGAAGRLLPPPPSAGREWPAPNVAERIAVTVPSHLFTLAHARPGQTVVVRDILRGAGETVALLRPGDVIRCRTRTRDWVIVQQRGREEIAVHRCDAALVQAERIV
jgi:hypothetical protein